MKYGPSEGVLLESNNPTFYQNVPKLKIPKPMTCHETTSSYHEETRTYPQICFIMNILIPTKKESTQPDAYRVKCSTMYRRECKRQQRANITPCFFTKMREKEGLVPQKNHTQAQ